MYTKALSFFTCLFLYCLNLAYASEFDIYSPGDGESFNKSLADEYQRLSDDSLLWAPYRSGLYFGIRPRLPKSLLSGLLWFNVDDYGGIGKVRHLYEQGDNMKRANWVSYDPRIGGREIIEDTDMHITIVIDFVKSSDGKSWGVKIKSTPHKGHENVKTSFVWYSGLEGEISAEDGPEEEVTRDSVLQLENKKNVDGYTDTIKLTGFSNDLDLFEIAIDEGPKTNRHPEVKINDPELDPSKTHHYSLRVPDDNVWKARDIFMTLLVESVQRLTEDGSDLKDYPSSQALILRDMQGFNGNLHFVQKIFEGKSEFSVLFKSSQTPRNEQITFENIDSKIQKALKAFDSKFEEKFKLEKPFNTKKYNEFGKEIMSGLLGGLSYFYGDHLVDRETKFDEETFESYSLAGSSEGPHELFTFVPSRPFFPRGFYWDEGFHLLPVLKYDSDLALEVVKSWFNLIDDDGWIAREQILGPELRSRVPQDFQVQSPEVVNPPTLMLILVDLLENIQDSSLGSKDSSYKVDDYGKQFGQEDLGETIVNNPQVLYAYAKSIYPKLKAHFEMFRRTQRGYVEEFDRGKNLEAYRWRGRTVTHCFASGLDDYPRALPADIAELNVDLLSWIGVMAKSMKSLARLLKYKEDFKEFSTIETNVIDNIETLHWSSKEGTYCDLSVDDSDRNVHVCHKGYVSLFPFLTQLIPPLAIDHLEKVINLISDPEELWTDYGIRSLSKQDTFYKAGENYWRSPIWVQMNSLILSSLIHYSDASAPYMSKSLRAKLSQVYYDLRINLVENVFKQWQLTGYVWEQYDDETGQGKGAKNFLGWTSTVLLIMGFPEKL